MSTAARAPRGAAWRGNALVRVLLPLLLAAGLAMLLGEPAAAWLRYDRSAVLAGQPWRLLTAHLVHLGWAHLALNSSALLMIALLVGHVYRASTWAALVLASALGVGLGLLGLRAHIGWYVGLSGVAHGLIAASAPALLRTHPRSGVALLGVLAAKLLWEQVGGAPAGTQALIGGAVVVDAHLFGAIAGLLGGLLAARNAEPDRV